MKHLATLFAVGALALALPMESSLQAQEAVQHRVAVTSTAPAAHTLAPTPATARFAAPIDVAPILSAEVSADATGQLETMRRARGEGTTLMIVGAAGIVTGAVIDEGLVSLVGAFVGLYGLYLYLR
jgi:hypothetical protein